MIGCSLAAPIAHTPTLVLWKGLARAHRASELEPPKGMALMPAPYAESFWRADVPPAPYARALDPRLFRAIGAALPEMIAFVGELHAAGVPLLAGTDTVNPWVVPGASLHEEIGLLSAAGLSAEQGLACATSHAASALGRDDLGRIEAGCLADFVLLRGDPTVDLARLDCIEAVVAGGRLYRIRELREAHERARATLSSLPFRIANPVLARLAVAALRALPAPAVPSDPAG